MNLPVDIQNIERIEILKGPSARIYGQNAYAGAINIVTKQNTERGTPVRRFTIFQFAAAAAMLIAVAFVGIRLFSADASGALADEFFQLVRKLALALLQLLHQLFEFLRRQWLLLALLRLLVVGTAPLIEL